MTAAFLTAFTLAQMCWVESGFSAIDCAAEVYVVRRRAFVLDTSTEEAAFRYSALKNRSPRVRFALALRPGLDFPGQLPPVAPWLKLQQVAHDALTGAIADPCDADHWGAPKPLRLSKHRVSYDRFNARKHLTSGEWTRAHCVEATVNRYYKSAAARRACAKNGGADVC